MDAANISPQRVSATELATAFCRALQRFPALIGRGVKSSWIRTVYPVFCRSHGADPAPPFKDFAKALVLVMKRSRAEEWRRGRRISFTHYRVPAVNVIPIERRRDGA